MAEITKQELTSMNISEEQLLKLKQLFPEVFTEGLKVDWEKLKLTLGESIDIGKERYGMNWPGKADCFKTIQQPSIATLVPAREESIDFDTTQNLFIEGDNLEVLKLLQKSYLSKIKFMYFDPPYNTGKEFIYPDNYSETLETYLEYSGQIDGEGRKFATNTETDGRFHSKWINMMYPRLFMAKNLLTEDGVIFISIDDHEVQNLRTLCNEIFGEENFISCITIKANPRGRQSDNYIATLHDYIICYAKNANVAELEGLPLSQEDIEDFDKMDPDGKAWRELGLRQRGAASLRTDRPEMFFPLYVNPVDCSVSLTRDSNFTEEVLPKKSDGREGRWMWGKAKTTVEIKRVYARLIKKRNEFDIFIKDYLERNDEVRTKKPKSIWIDKDVNTESGGKLLKKLLPNSGFSFPKPIGLIKKVLQIGCFNNDIVLDFFAGSATTAHAVMELNKEDGGNRKFICVQIPEPTEEKSEAYKAGYKNIAEISKERIRRVSAKIIQEQADKLLKEAGSLFSNQNNQNNQNNQQNQSSDLGFKVFKLQKSNFKIWDSTLEKEPEAIQAKLFEHINHISPQAEQEAILYELLLKSGFELTTPIEKLELASKTVFSIADGQLLICLEKELTLECLNAMAQMQPVRVICLDEAFKGTNADALKTNAVQIMKSKGVVNFRTV